MGWLCRLGRIWLLPVAVLAILAGSAGAGLTTARAAGGPPTEPILRLETGMHTALIRRMGVDAAGQMLLTVSYDKTARLWSLQDGRLLTVLRPPLGTGNEGQLFAGALSPDGRVAAVAGWTGWDWEGSTSIYLFDTASGRLLRRLRGLPEVIKYLTFSPDGRLLAAGLGGSNGIRVWRTMDWQLAGEDRDYGGDCYGLSFDTAGRLVTTSWDGYLRLYDTKLRRQAKVKAPGGQPYDVAFSPDSRRVAVGYDDSTKVDVLSGQDLKPLFAADTTGVDNGDLGSVTWSADGRTLYAAGRAIDNQNRRFIRAWSDDGRGAWRDIPVANNTIGDLKPLSGGGVIFGAQDPSWGVVQTDGRLGLGRTSEIADFRAIGDSFRLAQNGSRVAFDPWDKPPTLFSLPDRSLTLNPASTAGLTGPSTTGPGLTATDWKNTFAPKLNGEKLDLEQYEMSRAAAIQGGRLLLGAEWSLRLFDKAGTQLWKQPAPSITWAVNFSGDGRLAVAAYSDGTIRWHRVSNGEELLALFPHTDGQRWIVWTPQGYYDASAGAEDLIGWQVNNGLDKQPDFFPASRFRDRFYRPDVIARVLDTLDVGEALRQADAAGKRRTVQTDIRTLLPPVIEIVDPVNEAQASESRLTVSYHVRSATAPVTRIKVLVDGRSVPLDEAQQIPPRGANNRDFLADVTIEIPPQNSVVSLVAENANGSSTPAMLPVKWTGTQDYYKSSLYVLAVGVRVYQDSTINLMFADRDAIDFATSMKAQEGGLYKKVTTKVLVNEQATKSAIQEGLYWLKTQTTSRDVAMFFLSGHGTKRGAGDYDFLPYDTDDARADLTNLHDFELKYFLGEIPGKTVFFFDTCYSGNVFAGKGFKGDFQADVDKVANELASVSGSSVAVFTSSTGKQRSREDKKWGHGAFTKAILEALEGKMKYAPDWQISLSRLNVHVAERVKELTQGLQSPTLVLPNALPDLVIARATPGTYR